MGRLPVTRTTRQKLGDAGELLARRHLEDEGYLFIAANWSCPSGELDLVMRDGDVIVFVEVKTRRGERLGTAEEAVTVSKVERLLRAAEIYLASRPDMADLFWRFDVIAVTLAPTGAVGRFTHLINAVHA